MLDHRFQIVQRLVQSGLVGLHGIHFSQQLLKLGFGRLREGFDPPIQPLLLQNPMIGLLVKGRNIAGERFPQIVDDTHSDDLVQIQLRELIPHQHGHQRQPPAVLCHALPTTGSGIAVSGDAFQFFCLMQDG